MTKKFFGLCLCAIAISGLLFVACDSEEPEDSKTQTDTPVLTIVNSSVYAVSAGGTYNFSYTLSNPATDGVVSCASDVSWISSFDTSTANLVSFEVAENAGYDGRTAVLTLTYSYTGGSVSSTVNLIQDPVEIPAIEVSETEISAAFSGGEYSFTYTVSNSTDTPVLSTDASEWIKDLSDDSGTVTFNVDENENEARTGTITLTIAYGSESASTSVTVTQSGTPSFSAPETTIYAAGAPDTYYIDCVSNNIDINDENYSFFSSKTVEWVALEGLYVDEDYTHLAEVGISVAANQTGEERTGTLRLTYGSIDENNELVDTYASIEFTIVQDAISQVTVSDLIGKYTASGSAYYSSGLASPTTWTMTIYGLIDTDTNELLDDYVAIDGLVPGAEGFFDPDADPEDEESSSTEAYLAYAYLNEYSQLVIPTELTGYVNNYYSLFIGWTPCTGYVENDGFYYSQLYPDCTFSYFASSGKWESDYGEFLEMFDVSFTTNDPSWPWYYSNGDYNIKSLGGFFDVTVPTVTITKQSTSGSSQKTIKMSSATLPSRNMVKHSVDEGLQLHRDFKQEDGATLRKVDGIRCIDL